MNYLLDVNALVAWGWQDHLDHERVVRWLASERKQPGARFFTSAIPQIGFVRVSVQRTSGRVTVAEACATLAGMVKSLGAAHEFLHDDEDAEKLPAWCHAAAQTTDAHLSALAASHGLELATLDQSIPGAWLIPEPGHRAKSARGKTRR